MPEIVRRHLAYTERLESRSLAAVNLIVIHCTELPSMAVAREYGERILYPDSRTGNSGHYYLERSGQAEEWVPLTRVAHHVRGFNHRSVGIELDNSGRYPDWFDSRGQTMTERYPVAQIDSLIQLLSWLVSQAPALRWIAGHEALDTTRVPASDDPRIEVRRKLDPGPCFPWPRMFDETSLQPFDPLTTGPSP